ncbi:hypothetical protein ThrDRAFT_01213 [Frankia casuarinae]|uniref:GmrSD restriction endonucleases C-terminal domain-containing protein n=2 Tax=Frankia casuarinae (strain DSM 45818 / CECT 9043 / HFP020203 / CcI3) TaxID=106370 RepID=Q2J4M2_FRACC|nr:MULTISPECIES: HNH endonuclease family protein [Frankia]ABD13770.1 conserved hypothetical protein [Frankia casuarinae]ETA02641.1 hypothetical protein CcI6DRAFT_01817 [Frankia sp. CcI6]EYT93028.1 hypothetical protein ThrDRAFT_01213 [Frankia casuarinae]KEZ37838.1 Protein of unknown function (DUF1524) [Frankia sp. CeD]TFE34037.1 HNH endonuclease [Frankia sp. B2]
MRRSGVGPDRHGPGRPGRPGGAAALAVLAVFVLVGGLTGCSDLSDQTGTSNQVGAPTASGSALKLLATLPIKAEDNSPRYRRDEFGPAWSDIDDNGCDTRNDILRRDLRSTTIRRSDGCTVLTGELRDPYTTRIIRFDRGRNSASVQIDHVVPLADAWRTGALNWTARERLQFANDPENLLAVDGPTNQRKSDHDAAEWLPPSPGEQCPYVARQVGLKARYRLWVVQAEADAMRAVLQKCPNQPALGLTPSG